MVMTQTPQAPPAGGSGVLPKAVPGAHFADPAPLGLAGFGLTTFVLSAINAHWVPPTVVPVVFGMAVAYGGGAQLLAGMWEFAKGNTFGATAFTSFGAFWISYWWLTGHNIGQIPPGDVHQATGLFLAAWGLFTLYMTVGASRVSGAVFVVFALLTITFGILAWGDFATSVNLTKVGGWVGIATAAAALYASFGGVTAFTHGKSLVPTAPR